jgi:hypothetical protein
VALSFEGIPLQNENKVNKARPLKVMAFEGRLLDELA